MAASPRDGKSPKISVFASIVGVLLTGGATLAQTINWTGFGDGVTYADPSNWAPSNVPDSVGETANFGISQTFDVLIAAGSTTPLNDLRVASGDVTFYTPGGSDALLEISDNLEVTGSVGSVLTLARQGGTADVNLAVSDTVQIRNDTILNITDGAEVTASRLRVGASGGTGRTGTLNLDGVGSSLHTTGSAVNQIGSNSTDGFVNVTNGATAAFDFDLELGGGTAGTEGELNILSGGGVTASGDLLVGVGPLVNRTAIAVAGVGSTFSQTGASAVQIGNSDAGNSASITVDPGGVFTTGSGGTTINPTGTLTIDGGDYNAVGGLNLQTDSTLTHTDGVFTVTDGDFTPVLDLVPTGTGSFGLAYELSGSNPADSPHLVIGSGGTADLGPRVYVGRALIGRGSNGALTIRDGGQVDVNRANIGESSSAGVATVDGEGSRWTIAGSIPGGGQFVTDGRLTIEGSGANILNITNGGSVANADARLTTFGGGSITVNVDGVGSNGAPSTWTSDGLLSVGFGPSQTGVSVNVTNGGRVASEFAEINPGSGTVTIDGTDDADNPSSWITNSRLTIEDRLVVSGGALATSSEGHLSQTGVVMVDGDGSRWSVGNELIVGSGGDLDVTNGGVVAASDAMVAARGTVTVDGADSMVAAANLAVQPTGNASSGDVEVTNGGRLVSDFSDVVAGSVTIHGSGSTWTNSQLLTMGGFQRHGTLEVVAGATASSVDAHIALPVAGSSGVLLVEGTDSRFAVSNLYIGGTDQIGGGVGRVALSDQGLLDVSGELKVWGTAVLQMDGGTLRIDSTAIDVEGALEYVAGTFHLTDAGGYTIGANAGPIEQALGSANATIGSRSGLVIDQTLTIPVGASLNAVHARGVWAGGRLVNDGLVISNNTPLASVNGLLNNGELVLVDASIDGMVTNDAAGAITVVGDVSFNGLVSGPGDFFGPGTATFNGGIAPGASPAEVSFEGDIVFGENNTLEIEIGGDTPGYQYDRLVVEGVAQLDGTLRVELIDLGGGVYEPQLGDSFAFLSSNGGAGGMWHTLDLPNLAPGLDWVINSGGVTVSLNVVASLPGDYNLDGVVDAADYSVWRDSLGQSGTGLLADGNLDQTIDSDDYQIWRDNYGASTASAQSKTPIPEPASLAIVAAMLSTCGRPRRCVSIIA